jgi:orotidine-5'-phosphate decarboxylase
MTSFGARLHAAVHARGPLCAGIDPHTGLLHAWGLGDDLAGLERFALTAGEELAPRVAVVKPQSAFYERFGSRGIAVLERLVAVCRDAGALVLLDVKRGDIGSTSQAYADAYLDPASPMAVDAITASPYLGFGSLAPMVETARKHDAGMFVLALTSNPEGPEVQAARTSSGTSSGTSSRTVADTVLDRLRDLNRDADPLGSFGAVVGATIERGDHDLDINGPLLAPGYGAQGGTLDDLRRVFGPEVRHVLPSTSRELLATGPGGLAEAADRLNERLRELTA